MTLDGALLWRLFYAGLLLAASWVDLRERRIPNRFVVLGSLAALIHAALNNSLGTTIIGGLTGALLLVPFALCGTLGMGDVKLALCIGLMVGWPAVIDALALGAFVAAVVAGIGLLTRRWQLQSGIPYGPFLVLGVLAVWVVR